MREVGRKGKGGPRKEIGNDRDWGGTARVRGAGWMGGEQVHTRKGERRGRSEKGEKEKAAQAMSGWPRRGAIKAITIRSTEWYSVDARIRGR